MANAFNEEGEEPITEKTLSITERLNTLVDLVKQNGNEEEISDLLRYPQGLLHEACNQGSVTSVKILLEKGVTTSEWDNSFLLPLHIAARNNLLEIATELLQHNSEGVDRPSKFGETPLHFACMKGHKKMAELLVKYKANVERRDHCENTTLHYGVASDNKELVEWLLVDKNMYERINTKNRFDDTPLHRAAVLQCTNVIPVLMKYKVKMSNKDKHGFTALDIASLLYKNIKITKLPNGEEKSDFIFRVTSSKRLPSLHDYDRNRSSSFSVPLNPVLYAKDGSTISLPTSAGGMKKPSATQAKRPVTLTYSNGYSRQVSGMSNGSSSIEGSRNSIYLRDKEQASKISEVLGNNQSNDDVHKIVRDQTAYDPPIDMYFVGEMKPCILTSSDPRLESKDHDIRVKINEKYWIHSPSENIECRLTAGLQWHHTYPQGHIFISPICFLSFKTHHPVPVTISIPHTLYAPTEAQLKRVVVFTSPTVNPESGLRFSYPAPRQFHRVHTSDLAIDNGYVSFSTTLNDPALFTIGLTIAPLKSDGNISSTLFPVVPLRCCLYVACPSDFDQYLTNTDIWVYIGMSLKTVETAMKKHVVPHSFSLEEKRFVLNGGVVSVTGELENSQTDWQASRRGKGLFRYTQIALSQDSDTELVSHHEIYPSKEAFFIECHNPKKALKFRVSVISDKTELVSMLVTPYTPPKVVNHFGISGLKELPPGTPLLDTNSSTESIPLKTSSV